MAGDMRVNTARIRNILLASKNFCSGEQACHCCTGKLEGESLTTGSTLQWVCSHLNIQDTPGIYWLIPQRCSGPIGQTPRVWGGCPHSAKDAITPLASQSLSSVSSMQQWI